MAHPSALARSLALLALAPALSLAGTIAVGPAGSGAAFEDIADAIAAAQPGDTILIAPGNYVDATPLVVDKSLTILGQGAALTSFQAVAQAPWDQPLPLLVTGIGPGEKVRIAGLALSSLSLPGNPASAVVVLDCDGPVVLSGLTRSGPEPTLPSPGLVQVRGSSQVFLDGCELDAGKAHDAATPALLVEDSKVYVNACTLRGASPFAGVLTSPQDGGHALVAIDSVVRVSRSSLIGADGTTSTSFSLEQVATNGGSAVVAVGSQVYVRGGFGSELRGGDGALLQAAGSQLVGAGGACFDHDASSVVSSTPDTLLVPGVDGLDQPTTPPVIGAGLWFQVATPLATLEVRAPLVPPGGTVLLDHGGQPGAAVLPYFSFEQIPALTIPGIFGEVLLDPAMALALPPLTVSGTGMASSSVSVPAVPTLVGLTSVVQSFQVNPGGEASLSAPALVAVR